MRDVRRARGGLRIAVGLTVAVLLSACGDGGDGGSAEDPAGEESSSTAAEPTESTSESPTETPTETTDPGEESEPTTPACSDVWVAGELLPQRYQGCFDSEKERWVQAMIYRCSSGQQLVTYGRTFYAAKGEQVNETEVPLARDPDFSKAMASCGA